MSTAIQAAHPLSRGDYEIETYSGHFINVKDPDPAAIALDDIAHALSNTCRYGGHCRTYYSVAEHAVLVSQRLEQRGASITLQLAGLHHDDPEAYLTDIPRPIKPLLNPTYDELTEGLAEAIVAGLGLPFHHDWFEIANVKTADTWALFVEAKALLPSKGRAWRARPIQRVVTPSYFLGGVTPAKARRLYLQRHEELTSG